MSYPLPWIGHLIEVVSLLLFGWVVGDARRRRTARVRPDHELWTAVAFGWILETLDMRIFGSYHYGPMTWGWLGAVPIYIPLLWATIIHSSMALSDRSGLPRWARPFLDGLLAVLIDLAIDAIAIRLGLWHWGIPINRGWFGVPSGNLCAWMWVAFWYSLVTRVAREWMSQVHGREWMHALVPLLAYPGLLASLILIGVIGHALGLIGPNERLWLFALHVPGFGLVVARAAVFRKESLRSPRVPIALTANRWMMHFSFLMLWALVPEIRGVEGLGWVVFGTLRLERLIRGWCEGTPVECARKPFVQAKEERCARPDPSC